MSSKPSIVITGTGVACGLGLDAETAWKNVLAARRGMGPMPDMESPLPPGSDGGQALDLPADFDPHLPREARYLRWSISQALKQAGGLPYAPHRRAVMLGTTLHGMRAGGRFFRSQNHAELADFLAGDVVAKAVAGFDLHGGAATTCSACSSSLGSIALGVTLLQSGEADVVIAGGYDPVSEYAWAGFNALRLVSGPPLRPFALGRRGMKTAEAYAIVILERAEDAANRNVKALATVGGWGESADAHHLTQPHPQGNGAAAAMRSAITRAGLTPSDIGLISAHATGTPDNDAAEFAAMKQVFGERLPETPVVAFKSHLGHTLGGAGAIELIFSAMALRDQVIPPTVLEANEQIEFSDLQLNRGAPAFITSDAPLFATLNTSLGFGGANTSVVLARTATRSESRDHPNPRHATARAVDPSVDVDRTAKPSTARAVASDDSTGPTPRTVVITGIGLILPSVYTRDDFRSSPRDRSPAAAIDFAKVESVVSARRVRRMSDYVKLTLAAATLAGRDAFGTADEGGGVPKDTAAILGTTHGSAGFSETYYRQLIAEGVAAANPLLFAEGVPNAAAAQLSLMMGLTGACQTIVGTRTAGLDALRLAMLRIAAGDIDRCIVSAGEEDSPIVAAAYAHCDADAARADDTAGAVALVLESAEAAAARGATVLATLTHAITASGPREAAVQTIGRSLQSLSPADLISYGNRAATIAGRRTERPEAPLDAGALIDNRFSITPLAALIALIDAGGSGIVTAYDPSGVATAVRAEAALIPSRGLPRES